MRMSVAPPAEHLLKVTMVITVVIYTTVKDYLAFFVFFLLSEPFVTKIRILQPTMYLITLVSEPFRLTKPFPFITAETLSTPHQV